MPLGAEHDARRTIVDCKVVDSPHDAQLKLKTRDQHGIDGIVPMQFLITLTWQNLDAGGAADTIVMTVGQ